MSVSASRGEEGGDIPRVVIGGFCVAEGILLRRLLVIQFVLGVGMRSRLCSADLVSWNVRLKVMVVRRERRGIKQVVNSAWTGGTWAQSEKYFPSSQCWCE
jgi:hypothetical protein